MESRKEHFYSIEIKSHLSFLVSMLKVIFLTRRNIPFIILAFLWSYVSTEITRKANLSMDAFVKHADRDALPFAVVLAVLQCLSTSVLYYCTPIFEASIEVSVEYSLFLKYLNLDFEQFFRHGPAKNAALINRYSRATRSVGTELLFTTTKSFAGIWSAIFFLANILESKVIITLVAIVFLATVIDIFLIREIIQLKKECIELDNLRAEELTECFENAVISRFVDEKERLGKIFASKTRLKHSLAKKTLKFNRKFLTCVFYWWICRGTNWNSTVAVIRELFNFSDSIKSIVDVFFRVEIARVSLLNSSIDAVNSNETIMSSGKPTMHTIDAVDSNETIISMINERTKSAGINRNTTDDVETTSITHRNAKSSILEFKNIAIFFRNQIIIEDISFTVNEGDKIALIGKNGSGKSTIFRTILGFLKHKGQFLTRAPLKLSYIPQNTFISSTIHDELARVCESEEEMIKISKEFGLHSSVMELEDGYKTDTSKLSHSQQRLIKVIQGVCRKADILLGDEPLSGLNQAQQSFVLDRILDSDKQLAKIVVIHETQHLSKFNKIISLSNLK